MKHRQALLFTLLSIVFAAGAGWRAPSLIIYNHSPSVPLGFYWLYRDGAQRPIARGDYVLFVPPPAVRELMLGRGWLGADQFLLKPVAALAGDRVCVEEKRVWIGANSYPLRGTDSKGRTLPHSTYCGNLKAQELFVLSPIANSFDSRYYGPLRVRDVIARAAPLWTS
ncbi:MAG: S26 family signal peptidase [Burkholderiales bacterium]